MYYGSINFDQLIESLKTGKFKTYKSDNGTRYANVHVFVNDQPDQFDNDGAICLIHKEKSPDEKRVYLGNIRESLPKEVSANDLLDLADDDAFPF